MPRPPRPLFERLLLHPALMERPPVLVDIGASGAMHAKWQPIAARSLCVAFDADQRELSHTTGASSGYKALHVLPAAVTARGEGDVSFFLTESPYCSSLLRPRNEDLKPWDFAPLFQVTKETQVPAITLPEVLLILDLDYIDWFKSDSQGTDLRLFLSLPEEIRQQILIAEFEPGLIDAYEGEDKLYAVLSRMEQEPFWLSSLDIKGPRRISAELLRNRPVQQQRLWTKGQRITPGWGEMTYLNQLAGASSLRSYLLGWMIAVLEEQYGFALELVSNAMKQFDEPLLRELKTWTERRLTKSGWGRVPGWVLGKLLGR